MAQGIVVTAATALEEFQEVVGKKRERYYAPQPVEKNRHDKNREQFVVQFPLCLLPTVFERRLDLILPYCLVNRTRLHEYIENLEPEYANLEDLMAFFRVDWELTTVKRLAAEAEQRAHEYQALTGGNKIAWVEIHQGVLADAYSGDLSLPWFAVYCAVKSKIDWKHRPMHITAPEILGRVNGFHSKRSYDCRRESFPIYLNQRMVYHYTKKLAERGFFERVTVGLWTWYCTRQVLQERGIKSLKSHALNVAKRNMAGNAKRKEEQLEIKLEYAKLKEDFAERDRQRREKQKQLKKQKAKAPEQTVDLDQLSLPFKLYAPEQISDKRTVRHRLEAGGKTRYTLTKLNEEQIKELEDFGVAVA